jgi:hypothetical protein
VHARTGTLTGIPASRHPGTLTGAIALSGLTQGEDGRWKVFSFVENDSTADGSAITDARDGLSATVNGCWTQRLLGTAVAGPDANVCPGCGCHGTFCEVPTVVLGAEERRGRLRACRVRAYRVRAYRVRQARATTGSDAPAPGQPRSRSCLAARRPRTTMRSPYSKPASPSIPSR